MKKPHSITSIKLDFIEKDGVLWRVCPNGIRVHADICEWICSECGLINLIDELSEKDII